MQRLWWGLLLAVAFAGTIKVLERAGVGSRSSRIIAAILYALSPRILTTLGAISSEAWVMALAPWVLLPVVCIAGSARSAGAASAARPAAGDSEKTPREGKLARGERKRLRFLALSSAVAILLLGAVNAVATAIVVLPAFIWLVAALWQSQTRKAALHFAAWWVPAGLMAAFWWVGPLLILGKYSPPFTDFIESSRLTTRWLNPMEVLRGTTSWTPFLSPERVGGYALATEPVFVVGTLVVALLGMWGLARRGMPYRWRWISIFLVGFLAMVLAVEPFSPLSGPLREFLDGAGAPLRNLHKFDPLVRLAIVAGIAHALRGVKWPGRSREQWSLWRNPEKNRGVVACIAISLLMATVTAPAWSGRIAPTDGFREVPQYWHDAADWLNAQADGVDKEGHHTARTMILPKARFGRQTWGNTRDEPAQPLLDVPWVVRDSVPLVQPEAIRALDALQRELESGEEIPALAGILHNQGVGQVLVRRDLTESADTPGSKAILRTLEASGGFQKAAEFGEDAEIQIFQVQPGTASAGPAGTAGDYRIIDRENVENVAGGPEVLPRLAEADRALGRTATPRTRVLRQNNPSAAADGIQTITDTPALRDHNYGNVSNSDSDIMAPGDRSSLLNPVRDYPVRGIPEQGYTQVMQNGKVTASSTAADPTGFRGAETFSGINAAVDRQESTAWRPTTGSVAGQWIELQTPSWHRRLHLEIATEGQPVRLQVSSLLRENDSDAFSDEATEDATRTSTTVTAESGQPTRVALPIGQANAVRVTILSAFGDVGISELTLTDGRTGEDYTPRRIITVPNPPQDNPAAANRWVFGQEIPEGTMIRRFTIPKAPSRPEGMQLILNTPGCNTSRTGEKEQVMIDGTAHSCGDTLRLRPGAHVLTTEARWVALSASEPLFSDAIRNIPAAAPLLTSGDPDTFEVAASPKERIIFTPSDSNPDRVGTLNTPSGPVELERITVNGWQQGWVVPAGIAGTLEVSFAATGAYQAWLWMGLALALILVAGWTWSWSRLRRVDGRSVEGPNEVGSDELRSGKLDRSLQAAFFASFGIGTVTAAQGSWGSVNYAGDSWLTFGSFAVSIVLMLVLAARR